MKTTYDDAHARSNGSSRGQPAGPVCHKSIAAPLAQEAVIRVPGVVEPLVDPGDESQFHPPCMEAGRIADGHVELPTRGPEPAPPEVRSEFVDFLPPAAGNAALARWMAAPAVRRLSRMTRFGTASTADVSTLSSEQVAGLEEELASNPGLIMSSLEQGRLEQRKATLPAPAPAAPGSAAPAGPAPASDPLADVLKGLGLDATGSAEVEARLAAVPAPVAVGMVGRLATYLAPQQVRDFVAAAPVAELAAASDLARRGLLDAVGVSIQAAGWSVADAAAALAAALRLAGKELGAARLLRLGHDRARAITAANARKCLDTILAKPAADPVQVAAVAASFIEAGHAQPAALVNSEADPLAPVAEFDVAANAVGNPNACRFRIVLPDGKLQHIQQGHTYEQFFFQSGPGGNNARNKLGSSLFAPGTDLVAKATAAVGGAPRPEMWNSIEVGAYKSDLDTWQAANTAYAQLPSKTPTGAKIKKPPAPVKPANPWAGAATPDTTITSPNFILAFTHRETIAAAGANPEIVVLNVSQLVPGASWMTEQMIPAVADAVGHLFGHP